MMAVSSSSSNADRKWWRSSKSNDEANDEHLHVNTNEADTDYVIFNLVIESMWQVNTETITTTTILYID
jgi:hypothetical protein